ncbi:hypothetical protein LCGC14_1404750 [marine sediment metagenome]|uniref:Uncharacterized protein n=1 Tax=marine sediment metagenome TaxID=412755 RepID=A0A0F9KGZ1_9ZZZZ
MWCYVPVEFYNPPSAILATGSKEGVELGGTKLLVSIDARHNLYSEGIVFSELSWGAFYQDEGLEDQIDTFETREFDSVRENPEGLAETIIEGIYNIINNQKIFYGIFDFEVDAFLNQNTVIPGLKLDYEIINKLLEAHKKTRDKNLFPQLLTDAKGAKRIKIEFQGNKKRNLHLNGNKLEDYAEILRLAKGFATGIVCTSRGAANLYIMSDNLIFKDEELSELYIDSDNLMIIEMGIERELLFPITWFRIDLGIKALETLELWNKIKDFPKLAKALERYDKYISSLVFKKFKVMASVEKIGTNVEDDFYKMSSIERRQALRDMAEAIKKLTEEYKK